MHIQYTFNAFCKIVIRHAAIDKILNLRRRWEREVPLDYLMNEKFVQLAEPEQLEEYFFTACGQTAVLYHAELAAALALLPEQTQEEIFRYYFLRQPQRVIGVHIGRTRSPLVPKGFFSGLISRQTAISHLTGKVVAFYHKNNITNLTVVHCA